MEEAERLRVAEEEERRRLEEERLRAKEEERLRLEEQERQRLEEENRLRLEEEERLRLQEEKRLRLEEEEKRLEEERLHREQAEEQHRVEMAILEQQKAEDAQKKAEAEARAEAERKAEQEKRLTRKISKGKRHASPAHREGEYVVHLFGYFSSLPGPQTCLEFLGQILRTQRNPRRISPYNPSSSICGSVCDRSTSMKRFEAERHPCLPKIPYPPFGKTSMLYRMKLTHYLLQYLQLSMWTLNYAHCVQSSKHLRRC